ncbi:hypothetical protein TRFO_24290 [Tritrichomonas foetus]|uniref:Uncharacterized protein n=1 Tax=Tritrichomonas foetus TaxID=1144522 RepID=A0A1J4K9A3_9EUKA|nr:hypothetical protein TRFO_24290 [Tritrichomonas foetus]|eukprot:OHT07472.1 hypothetical protein TRFO_24290 [Tritrichomonas foetus]
MSKKTGEQTYFIVSNEQGDHTKRNCEKLFDKTTPIIIESLKNSVFYQNKVEYALFYTDSYISVRIPESVCPLKYFPQCICNISNNYSEEWSILPHLSLFPKNSITLSQLKITFHDQRNQLPNLICDFPFFLPSDRPLFESIIKACEGKKWGSVIQHIGNMVNIAPSKIILRHQHEKVDEILFPFNPIITVFSEIFSPSAFQNNHIFTYTVVAEKVEVAGTRTHFTRKTFVDNDISRLTFLRSLSPNMIERVLTFQDDILSIFLKNDFISFLPKLLNRIHEEFLTGTADPSIISALKHVLSSSLVTVFMPFASSLVGRCDFKLKSWNVFVSWLTSLSNPSIYDFTLDLENKPRESLSTIIGLFIMLQTEFVERVVDTSKLFYDYFLSEHLFSQCDSILGPILAVSPISIENEDLTMILTRGFVYFCDLGNSSINPSNLNVTNSPTTQNSPNTSTNSPNQTNLKENVRNNKEYEFLSLPQMYRVNNKIKVVCALPISQWEFQPIPNSSTGTFAGPNLINVKVTSNDAIHDILTFWILFTLAKLELDNETVDIPVPSKSNAHIRLSYPYFVNNFVVSATVSILSHSWDVRFPIHKVIDILEKVRKKNNILVYPTTRKMEIPIAYTGDTQISICNLSVDAKVLNETIKFFKTSYFLKEDDNTIEDLILLRHMINSTLADIFFCYNSEIIFEVLLPFKISDFTYSLMIDSSDLLDLQLATFHLSLSQFNINNIPLLHFAALTVNNANFISAIARRSYASIQDGEGMTALFYAIRNPNLSICQALIDEKIDIDACNYKGISPLIFCLENSDFKRAKFLLENGAAVNKSMQTATLSYSSALFYAINGQNTEAVKLLLKYCGIEINSPFFDGSFVTHQCITSHFTEILKDIQLLVPEYDPNLSSDTYVHPLHFFINSATNRNNQVQSDNRISKTKNDQLKKELNNLLSIQKLNINMPDNDGNTPLVCAIEKDCGSLARVLISNSSCDIDILSSKGETPLFIAVNNNKVQTVKALIKAGVLVNIPNVNGMTPLYRAVELKNVEIVKLLLSAGALPNQWYYNGKLPLTISTGEIEKMLFDKGADKRFPSFSNDSQDAPKK